jgi:hypothetical protein
VADVNTLELAGAGGLLEALGQLSDPRSKRGACQGVCVRDLVAFPVDLVASR